MKYFKRLGIYKNSTGSNQYDPETKEAYSYGHWCYLKRINGLLVFNGYNYSSTTSRHQSALSYILRQRGIKIDIHVHQHESLSKGIQIDYLYDNIHSLEVQINRKGARKKSNEQREGSIEHNKDIIKKYRKLFGSKYSKQAIAKNRKYHINKEKRRVIKLEEKAFQNKIYGRHLASINIGISKDFKSLKKTIITNVLYEGDLINWNEERERRSRY